RGRFVRGSQFFKIFQACVGYFAGGFVSSRESGPDRGKIDIELYDLEADASLHELLTQEIAICAPRKCSVENDAIVGRKCGESVLQKFFVSLLCHLFRIQL